MRIWVFLFFLMGGCREKTKVAKANSPAVEDGPGAKRAKLDAAETTMVKKVGKWLVFRPK